MVTTEKPFTREELAAARATAQTELDELRRGIRRARRCAAEAYLRGERSRDLSELIAKVSELEGTLAGIEFLAALAERDELAVFIAAEHVALAPLKAELAAAQEFRSTVRARHDRQGNVPRPATLFELAEQADARFFGAQAALEGAQARFAAARSRHAELVAAEED